MVSKLETACLGRRVALEPMRGFGADEPWPLPGTWLSD
jgi:hypothetical protein